MASGNVPQAQNVINPSTMTFGEMKRIVASVCGAGSQPDKVEAASCIHRALDWIQNHDWDMMLVSGSSFSTVAGTNVYTLGPRHRKIHSMRVSSGNERTLKYIRKNELDRLVSYQSTQGLPTHFTMYRLGDIGGLKLWRTPDSVETIEYTYFKDFPKPTDEGQTISSNFPNEWEHMVITYAQFLCGLGRGIRSERLEQLKREAEQAKQEALMRDSNEFAEDVGFEPDSGGNSLGAPFTGYDDASRWW